MNNELREKGFEVQGGPEEADHLEENDFSKTMDETVAKSFDGVVVGWDLRFSFRKIAKASTILNAGRLLVGWRVAGGGEQRVHTPLTVVLDSKQGP